MSYQLLVHWIQHLYTLFNLYFHTNSRSRCPKIEMIFADWVLKKTNKCVASGHWSVSIIASVRGEKRKQKCGRNALNQSGKITVRDQSFQTHRNERSLFNLSNRYEWKSGLISFVWLLNMIFRVRKLMIKRNWWAKNIFYQTEKEKNSNETKPIQ